MNVKGVVFVILLAVVVLYVAMGYRAQHALERAVCNASRRFAAAPETFRAARGPHEYLGGEYLDDCICLKLRKTDARRALHVAWWTWPWTLGASEEDLKANFVRHFI